MCREMGREGSEGCVCREVGERGVVRGVYV